MTTIPSRASHVPRDWQFPARTRSPRRRPPRGCSAAPPRGPCALADRCQSLGLLLDDVDDRAEQVECLRQTDGAGQLARRRAEDVGRDVEPSSAESSQAVKPPIPLCARPGPPRNSGPRAGARNHSWVAESRATEVAPGHLPRPGSRGTVERDRRGGRRACHQPICMPRTKSAATSQFSSLAWNHLSEHAGDHEEDPRPVPAAEGETAQHEEG